MPITVFTNSLAADDRPTFGQMKADLARPISPGDQGILAMAGDAINQAIRNYNRFDWPWDVLKTDISLLASTDTYSLPQAYKKECAAYITDSGRPWQRMQYMPLAHFYSAYNLKSDGNPTIYTLENTHETGQITMFPRPISSANLRVWYYRRSAVGRIDDEPIDIPDEAVGYVSLEAWAEMLKRLPGTGYLARLGDARQQANRARAELVAMSITRGDPVGAI